MRASAARVILGVTILSGLHLWLASGQTLVALGPAPHDDQLFLSLGQHIAGGDWLGPFTNLTLAKGPFYPMWIAASFVLGVPLRTSQHLLYIAACVVTILALRPVVRSPAALVAVYAVLVFNPAMFSITRVLREGVYIPLTLLLAACLIGLFVRRAGAWPSLAAWAGGTGLALSGMWLAREETISILPPALFILAAAAFLEWRRGVGVKRLWPRGLLFFSPLAILAAAVSVVSGINLRYYGVFIVTEMANGDWLAAYGALSRVEHDVPQKYAIVPRHVRERIYRVSPAFAELRSAIEGDLGRTWMTHGCTMMPETCGDIVDGWFLWMLRDAVAGAGHYRSAPMALAYYRRLAGEVNAACDARTLRCGPPRATMMPPWRREHGPLLLRSLMAGTVDVVRFQGIGVHSAASHGDEASLLPFRMMTRDRLAPSADGARLRVDGWGFSPESDLLMTVRDATGTPVDATMSFGASGDVFDHFVAAEGRKFERARDARFTLWTPCRRHCTLVIRARGGDRVLGTLPLDGSARSLSTPELRFHIEGITQPGLGGSARYPVDAFKLDILSRLVRLYGLIGPALGIILIIGLGAAPIAIASGHRVALLVPLLMLVGAFLARIGLIGIIEATAMPIRNANYLGPAYPVFLLAGLVACLEMGAGGNRMWTRSAAGEAIRLFRSRRTFLLTVSLSSLAVLLAWLATGYLWPSRETRQPLSTARFCCKDLNGDGKADILWRQGSGAIAVWLVSGTSVVRTGVLADAVPTDATVAGVGDFNGDGKADILWRQGSGALSVWLLDGVSVIGRGVLPTAAPPGWTLAGVGDFNGDGKADLLWRQSSGAVAIWFLDGARIIGTGVVPGEARADWAMAGVGDFNGDGKADILWRQPSGTIVVWLLNGTNVIGTGAPGATQADWTIVGTGDFNGDGKADILWRQSSGTVGLWLLNGTAMSGSGLVLGGNVTDSTIMGVGDFNGDGKADILWQQASGTVSVWLLDGMSVVGTGGLPGTAAREWRVQ